MWKQLAASVSPLFRGAAPRGAMRQADLVTPAELPSQRLIAAAPSPAKLDELIRPGKRPPEQTGLDGGWDRRLAQGAVPPDFTLDLHGHSLDAAHARLDHGLHLAITQGARLVLLIAGKERPHGDHDQRGNRRGAIRAKLMDWLSHSRHAARIAAVRAAHPRHGGAGAIYIVLRRNR